MKVILVIVCAIVIANTLAESKQLPQLLIYEVTEKNGEPQVRLIKTQNRINLNDVIERDIKQSKDWYPYDDKNDWSVPNKYRDNLQNSKYSGLNYRSNNRNYKKMTPIDNENNKDNENMNSENQKVSNKYDKEIKFLIANLKRVKENKAKEKMLAEKEAELQKRMPMVVRWLHKLEEESKNKKKQKLIDNGQVHVGTMNLNDADKFLRNLINNSRKPRYDNKLERSKSALRIGRGRDDGLVDVRTAPPPPKNIYVPDYYD